MALPQHEKELRREVGMKSMQGPALQKDCGANARRRLIVLAKAFAARRRPRVLVRLEFSFTDGGQRKLLGSREVKYCVIHRHVGFDLVDYNLLLVRRTLSPELD